MKSCNVRLSTWSNISPCGKLKGSSFDFLIYVWDCKINANGKVISSVEVNNVNNMFNLYELKKESDEPFFFNIYDAKEYAIKTLSF